MLLLLIIGSWNSREDPFTVNESDGSHQAWEFPSVLRTVWRRKKSLDVRSFLEKGQKRRGLTCFFLLHCVPDDNRHV